MFLAGRRVSGSLASYSGSSTLFADRIELLLTFLSECTLMWLWLSGLRREEQRVQLTNQQPNVNEL